MAARGLLVVLFGCGVILGGCMQSTIEPASDANLTPRDKKLLAAAPYEKAAIPEPYKRHIVDYHRREAAGTIDRRPGRRDHSPHLDTERRPDLQCLGRQAAAAREGRRRQRRR